MEKNHTVTPDAHHAITFAQLRQAFPRLALQPGPGSDDGTRLSWHEQRSLAGFYHAARPFHCAIIGTAELHTLGPEHLPALRRCGCLILSDDLLPPAWLEQAGLPLARCRLDGDSVLGQLLHGLPELIQPAQVIHGVLLAVHHQGILLTGESGIGKSTLALALLRRGHYLVADDAPEFVRQADGQLLGRCPPNLQGFLHCRSLGMIDVGDSFGAAACLERFPLHGVVQLTRNEQANQDNWLQPEARQEILGQTLPLRRLPVGLQETTCTLVELFARQLASSRQGRQSAAMLFGERLERELSAASTELSS